MRKITFLFLFTVCSQISLFAQQDSVKALQQHKLLFFADSTQKASYNLAKTNPLFLSLMPSQISNIALGHQFEKGNFVPAQGSTKTNIAYLSSEGSTILGKIRLYGSFSYQKVFEDSTRFAHQTRNNESTPYYYGSPAFNHYERTIYNFKALANRDFLKDKFTLGLALDYHIADHFSNNDPRGSINDYQIDTKFLLGYNFTKDIQLGLGYDFGYGQEAVTIGYRNRNYYETLVYPNYVNYSINGYREPNPKVAIRKYDDRQQRNGATFSFKVANTPIGSFLLDAKLIREFQDYTYRDGSGIYDLAEYYLDKTSGSLLWTKSSGNHHFSALFTMAQWDGEDYNLSFLAKNYVYTKNTKELKLTYALQHKKSTHQLFGGVQQLFEERIDGISGNKISFQRITPSLGYGIDSKLNGNKTISAHISAQYGFSTDDEFNVSGVTESYFTRTVIFHDYLYNTASHFGASLDLAYGFPFLKSFQAAIKLKTAYTQKQDLKSLNRTLTSIPGNDRFFNNISLNLYF